MLQKAKAISSRYRHKLTEAESSEPPSELGGGILADDMGMGKSLSVLALIARTLDEARSWSAEIRELSVQFSRENRSRASLVIVPSTCVQKQSLNPFTYR